MKSVTVISASAGSGKTSRLARVLAHEVAVGSVRPEGVLAVTFTVKAAAELGRRAREELLRLGKVDEARRLGAARIGTVHAVCGRLASEFALDLGLSPDLRVLDEESATTELSRSLSAVLTRPEEDELATLESRLPDLEWKEAVQRIQEAARSNGVDPATLEAFAEQSVAELTSLLDRCGSEVEGDDFDRTLVSTLETFLSGVTAANDTTKTTAAAGDRVRRVLAALRGNRRPSWSDIASLANLETAKASRSLAEQVQVLARDHDRHSLFRRDLTRVTRLCFSLAARSLAAYAKHKRERGVVDFADQEALALRLLGEPAVRDLLAAELDLVLVDEFQDTSPLQLALFLSLAGIATSVWVGDQKQAIYGFRGTDPALMDAAVEALLGGREPETLSHSWRSRPALVRLGSEVFVPAFGQQGMPDARVRLLPGYTEEPAGLGPVIERWSLNAKNKEQDAAETAARVRGLLDDPETLIRDLATGKARRPRPGDVAVLCRTNDECQAVAKALAANRLETSLPRAGAAESLEGRVLLAGLRVWADPRDSLAAATLARLVDFAGDPDGWLTRVLSSPGVDAFEDLATVSRVHAAREASPLLGPESAIDSVLDALNLRELCLSWGSSASRLASLEELRAAAVTWTARRLAEGRTATVLGFLESTGGTPAGSRPTSPDAVVVSTLHGSKGLEWPVVVLALAQDAREPSVFGVDVLSEAAIELARPLAGRRIVFWPQPYSKATKRTRIHALAGASDRKRVLVDRAEREDLRLLYVAFTRARDRVVLASRAGKLPETIFRRLGSGIDDAGPTVLVDGHRVETLNRAGPTTLPERPPRAAGAAPVPGGPAPHPPAFVLASTLETTGKASEPISIGPRLPLRSDVDMELLGDALHGFLAADRPSFSRADRLALAVGLLSRWRVEGSLTPETFLDASDALAAFVDSRYPGAVWHRELPLRRRLPSGSVLSGTADLVLETAEDLVVIDHKSFPGSIANALQRAASHEGQLHAYAETVAEAWRKRVRETLIHLPILGIVLPVERQ